MNKIMFPLIAGTILFVSLSAHAQEAPKLSISEHVLNWVAALATQLLEPLGEHDLQHEAHVDDNTASGGGDFMPFMSLASEPK
jgi:hypothetical protein